MQRLATTILIGLLAVLSVAGPVAAKRDFGSVYANDAVYRTFGNPANVPDGTGTDPFAIFTNSSRDDQFGVARFAPGSATGHHGGRWAVYRATWTTGDASTLVTSWDELVQLETLGQLRLTRDAGADFRCPVLGHPAALP
jgi:hypothetical protein